MRSRLKRIEISVLPSIEALIIQAAYDDHDGNVSKYVRHLIVTDLVNRNILSKAEAQIAREAED